MKRILKFIKLTIDTLLFNPFQLLYNTLKKWVALPYFIKNIIIYNRLNNTPFKINTLNILPVLTDRFAKAGFVGGHYFFQDLWAANHIYENKISEIVDIGSRIDGYIIHIISFCKVTYIDIRDSESFHPNFTFKKGSIMELPYENNSIKTISCLHVIEHIGLGRYNDPIDPDGYLKAANEIIRVLEPGGKLILGTPVGKQGLYFDAHRVFDPETIIKAFDKMALNEFSLIDDSGDRITKNANFETARNCKYACGLFIFIKTNESN